MKNLLIALLLLFVGCEQSHESFIEGYEARCEELIQEGWSYRAAHIIAGVECDLYDASDTLEWNEYNAYMED